MTRLYIILTIFFAFIQMDNSDQFKLPQEFYKLTIGKSTEDDVKNILGKPTKREEVTKDVEHYDIKTPTTMFFQYEDKKIDIMFRRKNKRSKYILDHIGFSV